MNRYRPYENLGPKELQVEKSVKIYEMLNANLKKPLSSGKYDELLHWICDANGRSWFNLSEDDKSMIYDITISYKPLGHVHSRTIVQGFRGSSDLADTLTDTGLSETGLSQ